MSENSQKESVSVWKWLIVIVCAAFAYGNFTTPYYFTKSGRVFFRGNTHTGSLERLDDNEWVNVTESLYAENHRLERKKLEAASFTRFKTEMAEIDEDDEEDPLDFIGEQKEDEAPRRYYF